jgi:hypothetical protein
VEITGFWAAGARWQLSILASGESIAIIGLRDRRGIRAFGFQRPGVANNW